MKNCSQTNAVRINRWNVTVKRLILTLMQTHWHIFSFALKNHRHQKHPGVNLFFLLPLILSNAHPLFNDRHAGSPLLLKNSNRLSIDCQLFPGWDNWSPSSFETGKFDAFVPFFFFPFSGYYSPHLSYLKIPWFSAALGLLYLDRSAYVRPPLLSLTPLCRH